MTDLIAALLFMMGYGAPLDTTPPETGTEVRPQGGGIPVRPPQP